MMKVASSTMGLNPWRVSRAVQNLSKVTNLGYSDPRLLREVGDLGV